MRTEDIFMEFGEQLARLRSSRRPSQEALARSAGIARATVAKAEQSAECTIKASTALLILKALANATPPLSVEEANWLASETGLDRSAALAIVPQRASTDDSVSVDALTAELLALVGPRLLRDLLASVTAVIRASRQPAEAPIRARSLIVKHPPIQREGFVEQTEVEYTERPRPDAPSAGAASSF